MFDVLRMNDDRLVKIAFMTRAIKNKTRNKSK